MPKISFLKLQPISSLGDPLLSSDPVPASTSHTGQWLQCLPADPRKCGWKDGLVISHKSLHSAGCSKIAIWPWDSSMEKHTCTHTQNKTSQTPPRSSPPHHPFPIAVGVSHLSRSPIHWENFQSPLSGRGGRLKVYTEHSFWFRSEAVRAKGVGFLVSKGAQAKLPLLVAAPLREMRAFPLFSPSFCKQRHKSWTLLRFWEWGWDYGCLVRCVWVCVFRWSSPSRFINISLLVLIL